LRMRLVGKFAREGRQCGRGQRQEGNLKELHVDLPCKSSAGYRAPEARQYQRGVAASGFLMTCRTLLSTAQEAEGHQTATAHRPGASCGDGRIGDGAGDVVLGTRCRGEKGGRAVQNGGAYIA
jgi:hypothetical protein